jgi:hypothetical protein
MALPLRDARDCTAHGATIHGLLIDAAALLARSSTSSHEGPLHMVSRLSYCPGSLPSCACMSGQPFDRPNKAIRGKWALRPRRLVAGALYPHTLTSTSPRRYALLLGMPRILRVCKYIGLPIIRGSTYAHLDLPAALTGASGHRILRSMRSQLKRAGVCLSTC